VADDAGAPATVFLVGQDEAADRPLAALVVAIEAIVGQSVINACPTRRSRLRS
jgi:hypothetical protein